MGAFAKWKVPAWQERDFGTRDFKWNLLIGISTALSLAFSHLAFFLSENSWISLCIGMLGFLVVLASVTDFALMKIPSELTTLVQYAPLPFVALLWPSFDFLDKTSMVMWAVLVFIFAVLSFMRFFGWADVKILFAFGTTLSWWVGPEYMMYALLGSSAFALLALPITNKLGYKVKKHLGDSTKWDSEEKKFVAVDRAPIAEEELEGLDRKAVREVVKKKKGKKKTFLPFGPALLISFLVMALIAAGTMEVTTYTFFNMP
jgi:prepilin signal peptidase PulO-like enzyme (type II secretory pathway)